MSKTKIAKSVCVQKPIQLSIYLKINRFPFEATFFDLDRLFERREKEKEMIFFSLVHEIEV